MTKNNTYDILVIGAGIVGLASAVQILTQYPGLKVCVLDKEDEVSKHQTGHNSGVIHSGIYYTPGESRALNCARGYKLLLDFCAKHDVKYELCGKVIVATSKEELPLLDKIFSRGMANGLKQIRMLPGEEVKEVEPHVQALKGILVPETGIIDFREMALTYKKLIAGMGGKVCLGQKVLSVTNDGKDQLITTGNSEFRTRILVNCAGLYSDKIARMTQPEISIKIIPFRGEYYELKKEKEGMVNNLIYPVPNPSFPFLGVHYTRRIAGGIEAGPNAVLAFAREGYSRWDIHLPELLESLAFPGLRKVFLKYWKTGLGELYRSYSKQAFVRALKHLIPGIEADDLQRGGAGVRAMACHKNGTIIDDFLIFENKNVLNVCNAPSPAATASLAIGETVAQKAINKLKVL